MKPIPIEMPDYYQRVREAFRSHNVDPFDGEVSWCFKTFRHMDEKAQSKTLEWFRKDFPKLYAILIDIKLKDEQQSYTGVKQ